MAREARADLAVGWVRRRAARVAGCRRKDARQRPEALLGAPEAAHAEEHALVPRRERRLEGPVEHEVALRVHMDAP